MARRSLRIPSNQVILVVDDQEETLISLRALLEREGHRVLTAASGEEALGVIGENEIHLILVDYVMPRMNGGELVREIRRFDPFVQIILQTGYAGERPPRVMLAELDIQGYHDKGDGPDRLLVWVDVGLKAYRMMHSLRERERLQSELVENCSHEFRTPLNIIQGYASLLAHDEFGNLPDPARPAVGSILKATAGLTDLVTDFLHYAKTEAGGENGAPHWIETAELVREMQTLGGLLVDAKPVQCTVTASAAPPGFTADGVKLKTILRNLLGNAAKFTPAGRIALDISVADGALAFAITDTGPGIKPEDQEVVFEAFRQIDGSSTRQHGGVGLGLALSRRLARALGGTLSLESTPGEGSRLTLRLPLAAVGLLADRMVPAA